MKAGVHPLGDNAENFRQVNKPQGFSLPVVSLRKKVSILASAILIGSATPAGAQELSKESLFYEGYLNDFGYDIVDKEGFDDFVGVFGPVLDVLHTHGVLTGYDINDAMNLYSAWLIRFDDPENYAVNYSYFLQGFPNPDIPLADTLSDIGVIPPVIHEAEVIDDVPSVESGVEQEI